ncbi:O-antigen ligase family protein [Thomasclavelia cocleata]|uniref:O-antigen ligase family protein n=1 Tax=Thomasclavelia cocleata TaxID=69824 RepID=UPI00242DD07D|nr:O-antigen ligase family protein [Thomasclavelia cocleata]MCI9630441.1 O-antigen ligase family protein [Thomasclavelia cocleata]
MQFIHSLKKHFSKEQLMIILTALSLSTPFYICVPFLLLETLYLLYTKKIINVFKTTPKSKYLIIFMILTLVISLIYRNWIGAGCVVLIFIFVSLMLYYRKYINEEVFELILDMLIALSILWAIYGLYEQLQILNRLGYDHFTLKVFSRRENRLNSVFFNANYYAMMIEFIIMMIGYKIFGTKELKKQVYYFITACINFFLLYMTGCRTAFIATAVAMLVFLIINKNYWICCLIGMACIVIGIFFIIHPEQFPRIEKLVDNFTVRTKIWHAAIEGIKAHPLFGQGPMTYMMIFKQYAGHNTQHAHSIYLDPILSFGVIGVTTLIPYILDNCKRLFKVYKQKINLRYVALVISCIVVILLHGTLDYTIFWVHTGMLFLMIASSFEMFKHN